MWPVERNEAEGTRGGCELGQRKPRVRSLACVVGRCVGFKGFVFFAALVALVPISLCGDAARVHTHTPGAAKGLPKREVSHVDLNAERVPPSLQQQQPHPHSEHRSMPMGAPRREVSHADIVADTPAPKLELRSGSADGTAALHSEKISGMVCDTQEDEHWQSQIVYSGEVLGVGSFSVVHAARNISSGQNMAVKIVRIPVGNDIFVKRLTREVKILRDIDHPNIVQLAKVLFIFLFILVPHPSIMKPYYYAILLL